MVLAKGAEAIQRGEHVQITGSAVREVTELHSAVLKAADTNRQLTLERERSAVAERMHRMFEISATLAEPEFRSRKNLRRCIDGRMRR